MRKREREDKVKGSKMEEEDGKKERKNVKSEKKQKNSKEKRKEKHHLKRLQEFQKTNKRGVKRGGASDNVHATTGAQPGRNKRGVHQSSFATSHVSSWNCLAKMVKRKDSWQEAGVPTVVSRPSWQ